MKGEIHTHESMGSRIPRFLDKSPSQQKLFFLSGESRVILRKINPLRKSSRRK